VPVNGEDKQKEASEKAHRKEKIAFA